jgi:hypothetical protein
LKTRADRWFGTRARAVVAVGAVAIGACAVGAACSLGLDESKIPGETPDGGAQTEGGVEPGTDSGMTNKPDTGTTTTDSGADAGPATTCTKDTDCSSTDPCLVARCDIPRSTCVYDICPTKGTTCSAATCTMGKCGAATPYKFASATKIAVPSGLSCAVGKCIVAVHPFVFLGTNEGVVAYAVDPVNPSPQPIVVSDIPFLATGLGVSGGRVWVVGGTLNNGVTRTQIAWIDVPASPLVTTIHANVVLPANNQASGDTLFPEPAEAALLTANSGPIFAGILSAPFAMPPTITQYSTDAGGLGAPAATSGTRLVLFRAGANPAIDIIAGAGTATSSVSSIDGTSIGQVAAGTYSQGPDGSVRVHAQILTNAMGPVYKTRVVQVLDSATSTALGTKVGIDVDLNYTAPPAQILGTTAWVDATSELAASAVAPGVSSHVQWLDTMNGKKALTFATTTVDKIGVASSAGVGWAVTADAPTAASLYFIAPACAP